jgi:hypothetical protein
MTDVPKSELGATSITSDEEAYVKCIWPPVKIDGRIMMKVAITPSA